MNHLHQSFLPTIIFRSSIFLYLAISAKKRMAIDINKTRKSLFPNPSWYMDKSQRIDKLCTLKTLWIILQAISRVSALKNIHEKSTRINVIKMRKHLFSRLVLLLQTLFFKSPTIWYMPCSSPHTAYVTDAPCHNPLARNTNIRFLYLHTCPFRFPPNGIYK